jgi:hypothetical protein
MKKTRSKKSRDTVPLTNKFRIVLIYFLHLNYIINNTYFFYSCWSTSITLRSRLRLAVPPPERGPEPTTTIAATATAIFRRRRLARPSRLKRRPF